MEIRYCRDCDQPYYWPGQCNCKENRFYWDEWLDQDLYAEPVCAECGVPLRGEDVEAGETTCLDCQTII